MSDTTPVAIIGGGPVGTALAIDLAQRGVPSTLIERHHEPQPVPKGQNLTQRTVEHFRRWGIEDELRAARTQSAGQAPSGLVVHGNLLGEHYYPWLQRDLVGKYYATANERLPQYATEAVLRERLRQFPEVTVHYGWTVENVEQSEGGVQVEAVNRDGERQTIEASWAVGCDGGRSQARRAAGITQTQVDHDRLMVLVVFRSTELDRILQARPEASFIAVLHPDFEGYWQFFGRVDAAETWFFHAPVDPASTASSIDLPAILARAIGQSISFEVEYLGFWDLRFALADSYRQGRILIAGDAAHSHPPYGGYGINSGFEDAANLGWKLAATIHGWAGPSLLQTYDSERRPVFASTRDDFIDRSIRVDASFLQSHDPTRDPAAFAEGWRGRQLAATEEVHAFAPHYDGSPIVFGTPGKVPSAVGDHSLRARPGHHLSPGTTVAGEPVFDALGRDFSLLLGPGVDAGEFELSAAFLGIPLSVIGLSPDSRDAYGASAILVRPDEFVAWVGDPRGVSAEAILRTAVGYSLEAKAGESPSLRPPTARVM